MNPAWPRRKRSAWKGIAAGIAGGMAGAYAMGLFATFCAKASEKMNDPQRHKKLQRAAADAHESTAKAADKLLRPVLGRRLTYSEKNTAKPLVHYAFGTGAGALYGATTEYVPIAKSLAGAPFGAAVFVGVHSVALPALHLTKSNRDYPLTLHAAEFGAHLVYGITLEGVRRLVRRLLRA